MKHEALTIWSAEDFARPEKLAALRVGDEVAFQLKNGKDAAFVVTAIADGVLTGCLFKGVRDMAMYDGRRWWNTDYVNYPESDARERLNEELLPLLPDELAALLVERTITQTVDGETYTCTDKLWPLSAVEVFGENAPDWMQRDDTPDKPLPFFAESQSNRKAYLWFAWLRSPYASYSTGFCNLTRRAPRPAPMPAIRLAWPPAFASTSRPRRRSRRRTDRKGHPPAQAGDTKGAEHEQEKEPRRQVRRRGAGGVPHPGGCGEKRRAPAHRHGAPGHEAERRVGLPGAGTGHGPHRDLVGGHDGEADGMSAFGWICAYIGAAWLAGAVLKCVEALGR